MGGKSSEKETIQILLGNSFLFTESVFFSLLESIGRRWLSPPWNFLPLLSILCASSPRGAALHFENHCSNWNVSNAYRFQGEKIFSILVLFSPQQEIIYPANMRKREDSEENVVRPSSNKRQIDEVILPFQGAGVETKWRSVWLGTKTVSHQAVLP